MACLVDGGGNMLRPIPARVMTHSAVLMVPTAVDVDRVVTYGDPITLTRVCIQPTNETRKTAENTEVLLRAILFFDARLSRPAGTNWDALKVQADAAGSDLKVTYGGQTYTVQSVNSCIDDTGNLHHVEVGMI